MEENLVGYLLKSLDDETHQQVEASLKTSPELRARLSLLERALAPLAADAEPPEPRPGLVLSTLARIAEQQCRKLPDAPPPSRYQSMPAGRHWMRRPDMLVAACLLIVLGGLGTSALMHLWRDYHTRVECQNNLRLIGDGLREYGDHHDGDFPRVEEKGPRAVAGIFVPVLCDNGMLSPDVTLKCPAQGRSVPQCRSVRELEELYEKQSFDEFRAEARKLVVGYAYSLGYCDEAGHHGLRSDSGDSLPIVADRLEDLRQRSSANHGGRGQNVLYLDGHVEWRTNRNAGINLDDIFVNWENQVYAGRALQDTVLGPSDATPTPRE
jgi:prepilin-type processing-associated H-X9-DG protein